jgi:DNA-binding FadR family transcriptional regulator
MALRISFEVARHHKGLSEADLTQHRKIAEAILKRQGKRAEALTAALLASSKKTQMRAIDAIKPRL